MIRAHQIAPTQSDLTKGPHALIGESTADHHCSGGLGRIPCRRQTGRAARAPPAIHAGGAGGDLTTLWTTGGPRGSRAVNRPALFSTLLLGVAQ
jgi:hypothetical protein